MELAEGIEIGRGEGSVGHVEVFQMASVGTSIFGRPRRLSPDRRAHTAIDRYTLICEEPLKFIIMGPVSVALLIRARLREAAICRHQRRDTCIEASLREPALRL
ncbi:hypothetical protein [Salana multivorans]